MNPLQHIVQQAGSSRILVVGDVMLDEYVRGTVRRVSPEAPIPVVEMEGEGRSCTPGGAANVAHNLARLGCRVSMVGIIGRDDAGNALRVLLEDDGVDTGGLIAAPQRMTSRKTRVMGNRQQLLRLDREETRAIEPALEQQVITAVEQALPRIDLVAVSDYAKGVLTPGVLQAIITPAVQRGLRVIVGPKGRDFERYRGCDVLTLNQFEAETAAGYDLHGKDHFGDAARALMDQTGAGAVLITLGARGMALVEQGRAPCVIPCEPREVFDVGGAGDTVLAVMAWLLAAGNTREDAARIANVAAGIVVGKTGIVAVDREALLERLHHEESERKIKQRDELVRALERARAAGAVIVFTNGCFDLLHPGHVQLLQAAKRKGDVLVTAINTDASVRQLKGSHRPILKETERAYMLAALDCVDYVTVFAEPTPIPLLKKLRPDVLVKGGDYRLDQVVGREVVEACGGRVEVIPIVHDVSTTGIVDRVLKGHARAAARNGE